MRCSSESPGVGRCSGVTPGCAVAALHRAMIRDNSVKPFRARHMLDVDSSLRKIWLRKIPLRKIKDYSALGPVAWINWPHRLWSASMMRRISLGLLGAGSRSEEHTSELQSLRHL